ncbi:UDP-3-O-(3-hydroxymyristoyl)glucosamine N-acyltransferase [Methylomarinum sp. Ch1-1]|uniref:UDP-3-O-acylglucosamine N-acyltransferase n=1 Tax=Methylomarinum roseum TaxID=3067653 RepID=A0AAU7NUW4_9GAMM|nr:UDP-3-O-(3-hydroxymyristoyl)glucosamine N-acyltransferase [Methylomarinum sp. Ch1-1]MDP4519112.1 UDP-3-O-(3-hydroxymyristoyl)glucosamine N-acyltransferase [Methylomarinum sp. Ch1-1]
MTLTIQELAQACDAQPQGGDPSLTVHSAADIMSAEAGQVTVLSDNKYKKYLKDTQASACFIANTFNIDEVPAGLTLLRCDDPEICFLSAVGTLHPTAKIEKQISPQAVIAENSTLGDNINIGPFSTIGQHSRIGDDSDIYAGVHIGNNVSIGKHCKIYSNAVIYDNTVIGDNVIIHSGAIVAADGFGYKYRNNQHIKVPHVGNVVIADNVEIGANTCIDRGALGSTTIGAGSKIDNLVQLGHNNKVGRNVIICGQSGISGSCTIEDGAILAGSSGIADHVKIGQQAVVMARSGVSQDIKAGAQVWGSPAKDRKTAWKELAALSKLPELLKKFKELQSRVEKLEN